MNESAAWLKMLTDVAAEEAAVSLVRHLDASVAAQAQVHCGKEGHAEYVKTRGELLKIAGV